MIFTKPPDTTIVPVGGVTPESMRAFAAAGANGFGLGAALYKPGSTEAALAANARAFADALAPERTP